MRQKITNIEVESIEVVEAEQDVEPQPVRRNSSSVIPPAHIKGIDVQRQDMFKSKLTLKLSY